MHNASKKLTSTESVYIENSFNQVRQMALFLCQWLLTTQPEKESLDWSVFNIKVLGGIMQKQKNGFPTTFFPDLIAKDLDMLTGDRVHSLEDVIEKISEGYIAASNDIYQVCRQKGSVNPSIEDMRLAAKQLCEENSSIRVLSTRKAKDFTRRSLRFYSTHSVVYTILNIETQHCDLHPRLTSSRTEVSPWLPVSHLEIKAMHLAAVAAIKLHCQKLTKASLKQKAA